MATKTASVHARVEPELKERAERVFRELGLSTSQAITLFLRQVEMRRGLPFELRVPNEETRAAMQEVFERRDQLDRFDSAEEMLDALDG